MRTTDKLIILYLENRKENIGLRRQLANEKGELLQVHEEGRMQELDVVIRALKRALDDNPNHSN